MFFTYSLFYLVPDKTTGLKIIKSAYSQTNDDVFVTFEWHVSTNKTVFFKDFVGKCEVFIRQKEAELISVSMVTFSIC